MKRAGVPSSCVMLVVLGLSWIQASSANAEIAIELATAESDTLFLTPWVPEEVELRIVADSLGASTLALEGAFATDKPGDLILLSVEMASSEFLDLQQDENLQIGLGSCVTVPADSFVTVARLEVMATDVIATANLRFGGSASAQIGGMDPIMATCEGTLEVVRQSERVSVVVTPAHMQSLSAPQSRRTVIEDGLLIVNGRAVEPPYELRVEGLTFYINGEAVFTQLPPADPRHYLTLPEGDVSRVHREAIRLSRIAYAVQRDLQEAEDAYFRHMRRYFPNLEVDLEYQQVHIPAGTPGVGPGFTASYVEHLGNRALAIDGSEQPTQEPQPLNLTALIEMRSIEMLLRPNSAVFWGVGYTVAGISESDARHILTFGPGETPSKLTLRSGQQVHVPRKLWEQLRGTR